MTNDTKPAPGVATQVWLTTANIRGLYDLVAAEPELTLDLLVNAAVEEYLESLHVDDPDELLTLVDPVRAVLGKAVAS